MDRENMPQEIERRIRMIRSRDCTKCIGMNEIRLIDVDALLEKLDALSELFRRRGENEDKGFLAVQCGVMFAAEEVNEAPTINAEPVRQGCWTMHSNRQDTIICTVCDSGFDVWKHEAKDFQYCPACGARMDAKEDSHG